MSAKLFLITLLASLLVSCAARQETRTETATDRLSGPTLSAMLSRGASVFECDDTFAGIDVEVGSYGEPVLDVACGDCAGGGCVGCLEGLTGNKVFDDGNDLCLGDGSNGGGGGVDPPPDPCSDANWNICIEMRSLALEQEGLILSGSIAGQAHCECQQILGCERPGRPSRCLKRLFRTVPVVQ